MPAKREGRWLCPYCGAENLGRFESCEGHGNSGCGAGRGDVRFYLPENSPIVTDPNQLEDAQSGQDWICDHCDGANKNAYQGKVITNCVHCAELRTEKDKTVETHTYTAGAVPRTHADTIKPRQSRAALASDRKARSKNRIAFTNSGKATSAVRAVQRKAEPLARATRNTAQRVTPKTKFGKSFAGLAIGAAVALIGFLLWFFVFSTTETTLTVTEKSWDRVLRLQDHEIRTGEGWSIPSEGWETDRTWTYQKTIEVVDYYEPRTRMVDKTVPDGTYVCGSRDLGNGYFEDIECPKTKTIQVPEDYQHPIMKDEDVYAWWYDYSYRHWFTVSDHPTSGTTNMPYWAEVDPTPTQRTQSHRERYSVVLDTPEGPLTQSLSLNTWIPIEKGQTAIGHYNRLGTLMHVDY